MDSGLSRTNAPTHLDVYLLSLRWAALLIAALLSFLGGFAGEAWLPFPLAWGLVTAFNVLLSVYAVRRRPFAAHRPGMILVADAAQAGLATLLVGGYHSAFFALFLLLAVEFAVAFPVRRAAVWVFSAGALHVAAAALNQAGDWSVLGAYMTVGKLFILLLVGALAIAFSEQLRREEDAHQAALARVTQLTALNELFFQLNQPRRALAQTWAALLDGARRLLHADAGVVLLCDATLGCWKPRAGFGADGAATDIQIA
ncbi:MAG: hypothetical protein M1482_17130, partial [Chloroflexi bacterium]|nr:hypothetical protein [Chloroflexota bacterium]